MGSKLEGPSRRKGAALIFALALFGLSPAVARYSVEATTAKDWPAAAGKMAVLPAICPADFDCSGMNEEIAERFADREKLAYVGAPTVSQALLDAGTDRLTDENRANLAAALGVQSFFIVVIGSSETTSTGSLATAVGHSVIVTPTTVGKGSLEVRVISPDGRLLAKATGFGESGWRSGVRLMGALFEDVFERLFPEEEE